MHLASSLVQMTMLFLSKTACRSLSTARLSSARFLSSSISDGPLPVDVDHYTSGWNIEDIGDFTKPGKYNVQTYNKISPVVCIKTQVHECGV